MGWLKWLIIIIMNEMINNDNNKLSNE